MKGDTMAEQKQRSVLVIARVCVRFKPKDWDADAKAEDIARDCLRNTDFYQVFDKGESGDVEHVEWCEELLELDVDEMDKDGWIDRSHSFDVDLAQNLSNHRICDNP
jgi:hypothetical protein